MHARDFSEQFYEQTQKTENFRANLRDPSDTCSRRVGASFSEVHAIARLSPVDTTPCFRFVIAASASPRGQLLQALVRVRLARGTGFPNRHRSRACRPPGTDSADTGQPRESTVQTLRSAVMRRVAAGGKLECVFPR